jgi:putative acetyltransferase
VVEFRASVFRPRMRENSDDEALLALFNEECFQRFATHMRPFADVEDMRNWLAGLGPDRFEIVCESGVEFAGFAGLYILSDRQSHIGWFFLGVREKHQRRGAAALLMNSLLGAADVLAGVQRLQLTVYADNEPAIRLYKKFGFEIEGRHRDFLRRDDGPVDAFSMARLTTGEMAAKSRERALRALGRRGA